jgi:hypothetical protein
MLWRHDGAVIPKQLVSDDGQAERGRGKLMLGKKRAVDRDDSVSFQVDQAAQTYETAE